MVPLIIDTKELSYFFDIKKEDIESIVDGVVKGVTLSLFSKWNTQAENSLKQTKKRYLQNLHLIDAGRLMGAIVLDYSKDPMIRMIEDGCGAFDMKCIVSGKTRIYTSKGYKEIRDIKVDDLVLTHTGKFKRVSSIFKTPNTDDHIYKIKPNLRGNISINRKTLYVTQYHPILTNNGWKFAEDLDMINDKLIASAKRCRNCNSLYACYDFDEKSGMCSPSCRGKFSMKKGKVLEWQNKNAKGNFNWGFGSLSPEKKRETHKKSAQNYGRGRSSSPENRLWEFIKEIPNIKRQHPFQRNVICNKTKKNKYYYFDFAIPEHKICIEVNGERWHTEEQDQKKKEEIESMGWKYLSFWAKPLYKDTQCCVDEIFRVLNNHEGNYEFTETDFTIEKIIIDKKNKHCTSYNNKFNLTVEDDSSYIASGVVTHNSGFSQSNKKKTKKDGIGWFLTIPMRQGNPEAIGESDVFVGIMPDQIYKLLKSQVPTIPMAGGGMRTEGLVKGGIPIQFQTPKTRPAITNLETKQTFDEYKNKSSIYEGLMKKTDAVTGQSTYMSFRRVSDKSDPNAWIHTGINAYNLAEKAMDQLESNMESELTIAIDNTLTSLGFK